MDEGFKMEQIKGEKLGGREANVLEIVKTVGNQAMVQMTPGKRKKTDKGDEKPRKRKKADEDEDFVLDPEEEKAEKEQDDLDFDFMFWESRYSPEDVPKKYCYTPADEDCFGGAFNYSCVHIDMTEKRSQDNAEADKLLKDKQKKYDGKHEGYTWHHMVSNTIGECDMVLVKTEVHRSKTHIGAVRQYENFKRREGKTKFRYGS